MSRRLIAGLAIAAALTSACSSPSVAAPATFPAAPAAESVPAALQFTGTTLEGAAFNGASLQGKPAVLWFWAPWCPTCQRDAPSVGRVAAANPGVTFVGVAAQDELTAMRAFVDKYPVKGFTHLADADAAVWTKFGVTYQPAYAFIGADGSVDVVKASLSESELNDEVTALSNR